MKEGTTDIVKFLFEAGQLKRVKRSGWWLAGIKDPESVAEHSFRASLVGYILASLEGADADKVMRMCLFHDLAEARVNDLHKLGQRYIKFKEFQEMAYEEQLQNLPKNIASDLSQIQAELEKDASKEAIIAKDADLLECAFTAKEYLDLGYKDTKRWLKNIKKSLKTKSGKEIFKKIETTDAYSWWHGKKRAVR